MSRKSVNLNPIKKLLSKVMALILQQTLLLTSFKFNKTEFDQTI